MNWKKLLLSAGALVLAALIIATAIYLAAPARTIDFRGYITDISLADDAKIAIIHASDIFDESSRYTIYVEYSTRVTGIDGEKMELADLRAGDMIDLDYKRKTGENGERYAKWLTVCPQAKPTN